MALFHVGTLLLYESRSERGGDGRPDSNDKRAIERSYPSYRELADEVVWFEKTKIINSYLSVVAPNHQRDIPEEGTHALKPPYKLRTLTKRKDLF